MRASYALAIVLILSISACSERDKKGKPLSTPTSGVLKLAIDESLKPLFEAEIDTFEGLYTGAHIEVLYMSEVEAVDALLKDSVAIAITTRQLTNDELKVISSLKINPTQLAVAKDGIALIVNKANPDSLFRMEQLKEILEGKITNWKQLNTSIQPSNLEVVFDNPNSGMIKFLNDSVAPMNKIPGTFFALHSNMDVIDHVSKKPNAIGLIGVNWISDAEDPTSNSFLKTIRVVSLAHDSGFYKPYQAYLAMGQYPLSRKIYMISREARTGLASGFMTFVASDRGQRIVLKAGLVPVTMPVRIVEVNHEPLN